MKLVTSDLMRQIDRETIDTVGIPGPHLMENAGRGIAELILSDLLEPEAKTKVVVFCGWGNNGGDGYVIARYLHQAGVGVTVYFLGPLDKLSEDARLNFDRAAGTGIELHELTDVSDLPDRLDCHLIVDAIFGTGFSGTPRGLAGEIIEYINLQPQPVAAVDLPSGLNADNGQYEGAVVEADFTYTLALPKYGLYVSPGRELAGGVEIVPIGIPDDVIDKFAITTELITEDYVIDTLPERDPEGHKGTFGLLFLLAGSTGLTGAAALAAKSALRSGCGLAKIGCPQTVLPIIASGVIEATTLPLPDVARKGALALRALGQVRQTISDHDAVIIGPGLGRHHETAELVRRLVGSVDKPTIIDADGLNAFEGYADLLKTASAKIVLTPHPGEFKRLTGASVTNDIHQRLERASAFAKEYNKVIVLKGSPTIVATADGRCYVNQTGNEGMATGGSGDVLSGIIGSLLAQGLDVDDAARCGVYIHGLAGDLAAFNYTGRAMIAGDMVDSLAAVYASLE